MPRQLHLVTWGQLTEEAILVRSPGIDLAAFLPVFKKVMSEWIADNRFDAIPPENVAALDSLLAAGKQLAIVTSRTHHEVVHLLAPDHLLAERIKLVYYKDNTTHRKPDPRVFDTLLQENNLRAEEGVYIGDSVSDMVATNQAGMHFIACLESGLRTRQDFDAGRVDAFIDHFADVAAAVKVLK